MTGGAFETSIFNNIGKQLAHFNILKITDHASLQPRQGQ